MKNISAIFSTEVVILFAGTVKEGSPTKNVLEHLSKKISVDWRTLGRRLSFDEADLQEFDRGHEEISEKAYAIDVVTLETKKRLRCDLPCFE